ncbi:hypothetical protein Hanom_Chr16g01424411 [Helianthus anomalus]
MIPPVDRLELNEVRLIGYLASELFRFHTVEEKHLLFVGFLHFCFVDLQQRRPGF